MLAARSGGDGDPRPAVLAARSRRCRAALFVPERMRGEADADRPLPIGFGQTISQPFVVAFMTERLEPRAARERVLEVGTGSGYQTAILARLARGGVLDRDRRRSWRSARATVLLGDARARGTCSSGSATAPLGWAEAAPFDRIVVTAAAPEVPPALVAQLAPGGRMVLPVGEAPDLQVLRVVEKGNDGANVSTDLMPVRFVPLTGAGG